MTTGTNGPKQKLKLSCLPRRSSRQLTKSQRGTSPKLTYTHGTLLSTYQCISLCILQAESFTLSGTIKNLSSLKKGSISLRIHAWMQPIFFYLSLSIFLSRKRVDPTFKAIWADNKSFDEVLISKRMVQDHMPDNVLAALTKVRHFPYTPSFFCLCTICIQNLLFFSWWSRIHRKRATLEKLCRES